MRFVLVHGGLHAAWCWERVIPLLEELGHKAIAPDLPGHGERRDETASLDGYRDAVLEVIEPGDIVVGHSMGCPVITLAADAEPDKIRHLVYLAGPVPIEGKSIAEAVIGDGDPFTSGSPISAMATGAPLTGAAYDDRAFWFTDMQVFADQLYNDCSPEDVKWAWDRLQPQPNGPVRTPIHLENFWTSRTPRSYIACLNDRTPARYDVENRVRRLGIRVAFPLWASHSPFASRPQDLVRLLVDIVERPIGAVPDVVT